jgi:hypothetical protein
MIVPRHGRVDWWRPNFPWNSSWVLLHLHLCRCAVFDTRSRSPHIRDKRNVQRRPKAQQPRCAWLGLILAFAVGYATDLVVTYAGA